MMHPSLAPSPVPQAAPEDRSDLLHRAFSEFCQRRQAGEPIDPDAYCERYPGLRSSLGALIAAEMLLLEHPSFLGPVEGAAWPQPGDEFKGLRLGQQLGRGSFARVHLAVEPALGDRRVVVKLARRGGAEARTLGRLQHPHIVAVHSVREDPQTGLTALVMPFEGHATLCDLLDRLPPGPPPARAEALAELLGPRGQGFARRGYAESVAEMGACLADALGYAHGQGVIHRDLKPANVLLADDGRPMLLDFNLSADAADDPRGLGGTLMYMAPEQLAATAPDAAPGSAEVIDGRADLYALGVVLYELLAGAHPFGPMPLADPGAARTLLPARQEQGPRPLHRVNPRVSPRLSRVIHACLALAPADRPGSGAELARQLRQAVRTRPWRRLAATALVGAGILVAALALGRPGPAPQAEARPEAPAGQRSPDDEFGLALERLKQDDLAAASHHFQVSDQLQANGQARAGRAYCLTRLGIWPEALHEYERAREAGYKTAVLLLGQGFTAWQMKRLDLAEECLAEAVDLDGRLQEAWYVRGRVDLKRAIDGANEAVPYSPVRGEEFLRKALATGRPWGKLHFDLAYTLALIDRAERGAAAAPAGDQRPTDILHHLRQAHQLGVDLRQRQHVESLYLGPWLQRLPPAVTAAAPPKGIPEPPLFLDPLNAKGT